MRRFRIGLSLLTLTAIGAWALPDATADDWHCDPCQRTSSVYGSRLHCHGTRSYRDPCHPSTRYVQGRHHGYRSYRHGCRGYGTPWTVLRRYLPTAHPEFRRAYVRSFFLRRYPFSQGAVVDTEAARLDTLLAQAEEHGEEAQPLPADALRRRGLARFFTADYEGARRDFDAVLAAKPGDLRALHGRLFCAVCTSDVKTAVADLNAVAKAGDLKPNDRVDLEGAFLDAKTFPAVVEGLRGHARYRISDGDAWLVTAWALAVSGKPDAARANLRTARRWKSSNAALPVLEKNLGIRTPEPASAETPVAAPKDEGPVIAKSDDGKAKGVLRIVGR